MPQSNDESDRAEPGDLDEELRRTYARMKEATPPDSTVEATRRAVDDELRALDVPWIVAVPLADPAGVRSVAEGDVRVLAQTGDLHLDAVLHPEGSRGFALSGQVLRGPSEPVVGIDVAFYIDGRPAAETCTDAYGEFGFLAHGHGKVGVRLGGGLAPAYVHLWPVEAPPDGKRGGGSDSWPSH